MAAMTFPTSPSVDDEYTNDGTTWVCTAVSPNIWAAVVASSGGSADLSNYRKTFVQPEEPSVWVVGDAWVETAV